MSTSRCVASRFGRHSQVPSKVPFPRLRGVCPGRSARQDARGADRALARPAHRRHDRARRHRDRGAREAGQDEPNDEGRIRAARSRSADAQARTPAQARGTAKTQPNASNGQTTQTSIRCLADLPTASMSARRREQRKRLQGNPDRLTNSSRCACGQIPVPPCTRPRLSVHDGQVRHSLNDHDGDHISYL